MIPVEVLECSHKFQNFTTEGFDKGRRMDLDLLDEVRNNVRISSEALKRRVELKKKKNKVNPRQFRVTNLVLQKAYPYQIENKFCLKWFGPYRVIEVLTNEAYRLETLDSGAMLRTWNAANLKFYFS